MQPIIQDSPRAPGQVVRTAWARNLLTFPHLGIICPNEHFAAHDQRSGAGHNGDLAFERLGLWRGEGLAT
jgi:hypothetical protein